MKNLMDLEDGMSSYDQWKTASPYDDDFDPIEEGERYLRDNPQPQDREPDRAYQVIELLLEFIKNEV